MCTSFIVQQLGFAVALPEVDGPMSISLTNAATLSPSSPNLCAKGMDEITKAKSPKRLEKVSVSNFDWMIDLKH